MSGLLIGRKRFKSKWGTYYDETQSRLSLSNIDKQIFVITKIRKEKSCFVCNKTIPKNSICLGRGYGKICLECAKSKFLPELRESFSSWIGEVDNVMKEINDNKEDFLNINLLASLGDEK